MFSPIAIFDETALEPRRNQRLDLSDHAAAFVANDKIDLFDPGVNEGFYRVTN